MFCKSDCINRKSRFLCLNKQKNLDKLIQILLHMPSHPYFKGITRICVTILLRMSIDIKNFT